VRSPEEIREKIERLRLIDRVAQPRAEGFELHLAGQIQSLEWVLQGPPGSNAASSDQLHALVKDLQDEIDRLRSCRYFKPTFSHLGCDHQ